MSGGSTSRGQQLSADWQRHRARKCPLCGVAVTETHREYRICRACWLRECPDVQDVPEKEVDIPSDLYDDLSAATIAEVEIDLRRVLRAVANRHGLSWPAIVAVAGDLDTDSRYVCRTATSSTWTPAEHRTFVRLWNAGLAVREIAAALGRSIVSVQSHRRNAEVEPRIRQRSSER